jgi:hypothetical protein
MGFSSGSCSGIFTSYRRQSPPIIPECADFEIVSKCLEECSQRFGI